MAIPTAWRCGAVKYSLRVPMACIARPTSPVKKKSRPAPGHRWPRPPGGGGTNSRSIGIGPDGRVYASLGIQGNCSDQYLDASYPFDGQRGGVAVLHEAGGKAQWQAYA